MIIVMNRIPIKPEYATALEERFAERDTLVDSMDGFLSFRLLKPHNEEDPYIVMTMWESVAHFEAWKQSDQFKQSHAQSARRLPPDALHGQPKIEVVEVVQEAFPKP